MWNLSSVTPIEVIPNAVRTATIVGGWIDVREYEGNIVLMLHSEATNGADVTLAAAVNQADDGAGTGVAAAGTFATVDNTAGGSLQRLVIDTKSIKRFLRVAGVVAGTTPSFAFGVTLMGVKKAR